MLQRDVNVLADLGRRWWEGRDGSEPFCWEVRSGQRWGSRCGNRAAGCNMVTSAAKLESASDRQGSPATLGFATPLHRCEACLGVAGDLVDQGLAEVRGVAVCRGTGQVGGRNSEPQEQVSLYAHGHAALKMGTSYSGCSYSVGTVHLCVSCFTNPSASLHHSHSRRIQRSPSSLPSSCSSCARSLPSRRSMPYLRGYDQVGCGVRQSGKQRQHTAAAVGWAVVGGAAR